MSVHIGVDHKYAMTVFAPQGSLAIRCKLDPRLVRSSHTSAVASAGRDRPFFSLNVGD